jgi:hypothetical protein
MDISNHTSNNISISNGTVNIEDYLALHLGDRYVTPTQSLHKLNRHVNLQQLLAEFNFQVLLVGNYITN